MVRPLGFEPRVFGLRVRCFEPAKLRAHMADGRGFEPLRPCGLPAFEAGTFDQTLPTIQHGACGQGRTGDFRLTRATLCHLSYAGKMVQGAGFEPANPKGLVLQTSAINHSATPALDGVETGGTDRPGLLPLPRPTQSLAKRRRQQ